MGEELKLIALEFEDIIRQIALVMNKRLRDSLKECTITAPQFSALVTIYTYEGLTIGKLSDILFLACSTVSGLVDRLEKADMVERYRDTEDRRVVRVRLKEKGRNLTKKILDNRRESLEQDIAKLEISCQKELLTDLNLLLNIMQFSDGE